MRKDMSKVLVEDGRLNSGVGAKQLKRQHRRKLNRNVDEHSPKRESLSGHRHFGHECKTLNENLKPLVRFLASRAGQPWDEVYSEIRERINVKSAVQLHIMQHLWGFVDRDIKISDQGVPVRPSGRVQRKTAAGEVQHTVNGKEGWYEATGGRSNWPRFYVDDDGVLVRLPTWEGYRSSEGEKDRHREDGRLFRKDEGIWYEMVVVPLPDGWVWGEGPRRTITGYLDNYGPRDLWFNNTIATVAGVRRGYGYRYRGVPHLAEVKKTYGRLDVYCNGRRQLASKELRRWGLVNERPEV